MAIEPLNIPNAAGLDFAQGDVRHLAPGDSMDETTISRATRNLAERDNEIAAKVNEVVTSVNNREQFVNLPTPKLTLPPSSTEIITNYRIPAGFEVRVLNAAVNSSPTGQGKLDILYSQTFGGTSGDSVVSTMTEFTGGTKFYGEGDFIIQVSNIGSTSANIVSSIVLTMRPVSDPEGAILTSGIVGPAGAQGPKGDVGPTGLTGSVGPQGPRGMNWKGSYSLVTNYFKDDGVNYAFPSFGTWSFIATMDNTGTAPTMAGTDPWNVLASAAAGTAIAGPPGPAGSSPTFSSNNVSGTLFTQGDYLQGSTDGDYVAPAPGTYTFVMTEITSTGGSIPVTGVALLTGRSNLLFKGTVTLQLPTIAGGAAADYLSQGANIVASSHGTILTLGAGPQLVQVTRHTPNTFDVNVNSLVPSKVALSVMTMQPLT